MTKGITCPECKGHGFIDKHELQEDSRPDVAIATMTEEVCGRCHGTGCALVPMTRADRIRAMTDEELVTAVEDLLPKLMEAGDHRLVKAVCDGLGECAGDGNCTDTRHRNCIRRYLDGKMEDDGDV